MKKDYQPDYVKIASSIFLSKFEKQTGKPATGVLYNKYLSLFNTELQKTYGRDILKLPHCWYRWGDEVVRYYLPYLDWNHDDLTVTTVSLRENADGDCGYEDAITNAAKAYADKFIAEYGGKEGAEKAIDEVYQNAPFPFQNKYRMLRESLRISRKNTPMNNFYGYIRSLFEQAMEEYPSAFKELTKQKKEFEAVFNLAMESNASQDELFEISERFWFFFCYHLRLNSKCHFNVQKTTIATWEEVIPLETGRFEKVMQNYAWKFSGGNIDEKTDRTIVQLIEDRKERIDNITRLLAELDDSDSTDNADGF